jgi:predicted ATP-dependent endonuclease of OLD family
MIKTLSIKYFKGFQEYKIDFNQINLLIGANNSGKTTIFHALELIFWCAEQTKSDQNKKIVFGKTQVPELKAFPYANIKDLFYRQKTRTGNTPTRITLELESTLGLKLKFEIYTAFGRQIMINGNDFEISKSEYSQLKELQPIFIPSIGSITSQEDLYRVLAQDRLIAEGRHNQILRNLVLRLKKDTPTDWTYFVELLKPIFSLQGVDIPFNEQHDEWLSAVYEEDRCKFDLVSAGSGFIQVVNLLTSLFLHGSKVILLDEPDSHMHDDLQRIIFDNLCKIAKFRNLQLIISTHSPTFIDVADYQSLLLIDKKSKQPLITTDADTLIPQLSDLGLALPPTKVMETLRTKSMLFVEGQEADYKNFIRVLGNKYIQDFDAKTRGLTIYSTGGEAKEWPYEAIKAFEKLFGGNIKHVYISDRDFKTDKQIQEKQKRGLKEKCNMLFLEKRNREGYLLNPTLIAKLLKDKWSTKTPTLALPENLTEAKIKLFIIEEAEKDKVKINSDLLVYQEPFLKQQERTAATNEIMTYFENFYVTPLQKKEIPYKLLNSKEILKKLRTTIAANYRLSFSDQEILEYHEKENIPKDIKIILDAIIGMFP